MKKYLCLLAFSGLLALGVQPVFAQPDRPNTNRQHEHAQVRAQEAQAQAQDVRKSAEARVAEIKQEVEQRKATVKQEVCERRQAKLAAKMPRLSTGANSVKKAIDKVYERVQGFYESGQLTVVNYDELKAAVDAAKADSEASLGAVTDYTFELDCDNPNVGEQLDGYRLAINEARDSLKIYRDKLVDLISAMRSEAASNAENSTRNNKPETGTGEEGGDNDQE